MTGGVGHSFERVGLTGEEAGSPQASLCSQNVAAFALLGLFAFGPDFYNNNSLFDKQGVNVSYN